MLKRNNGRCVGVVKKKVAGRHDKLVSPKSPPTELKFLMKENAAFYKLRT